MKRLVVYGPQGILLERKNSGYCLPETEVDDEVDVNGENIFCFGDYVAMPVTAYVGGTDNGFYAEVRGSWKLLDEDH